MCRSRPLPSPYPPSFGCRRSLRRCPVAAKPRSSGGLWRSRYPPTARRPFSVLTRMPRSIWMWTRLLNWIRVPWQTRPYNGRRRRSLCLALSRELKLGVFPDERGYLCQVLSFRLRLKSQKLRIHLRLRPWRRSACTASSGWPPLFGCSQSLVLAKEWRGTSRLPHPGPRNHFWVNPFGMHFGHIRVSDLVLVNEQGVVVEGNREINESAFAIHSRLHMARPEVVAAAHAHSLYGKPWSSFGRLLDPLTQDACAFYEDHS